MWQFESFTFIVSGKQRARQQITQYEWKKLSETRDKKNGVSLSFSLSLSLSLSRVRFSNCRKYVHDRARVFLKMLSLFEHAPISAIFSNYWHSLPLRVIIHTRGGKGKRLPSLGSSVSSYIYAQALRVSRGNHVEIRWKLQEACGGRLQQELSEW